MLGASVCTQLLVCFPIPYVIVGAQTMTALPHLHGLPWHAMLAWAIKLVSIPRRATHGRHLVNPSNLGRLAAKLERLITD